MHLFEGCHGLLALPITVLVRDYEILHIRLQFEFSYLDRCSFECTAGRWGVRRPQTCIWELCKIKAINLSQANLNSLITCFMKLTSACKQTRLLQKVSFVFYLSCAPPGPNNFGAAPAEDLRFKLAILLPIQVPNFFFPEGFEV